MEADDLAQWLLDTYGEEYHDDIARLNSKSDPIAAQYIYIYPTQPCTLDDNYSLCDIHQKYRYQ